MQNLTVDALCNLWLSICKEANLDTTEESYHNALVDLMSTIEKAIALKLQDENPNIIKIIAILTNFGYSEPTPELEPLLKAYEPKISNNSPVTEIHTIHKAA
ncbi:hypothetical protein ME1_00804 [Bartonella vinsonii subsp. arupensis OK-94-513]|uniref:Uncharacterized protein n=1 Tax=Bartonella vinsonii subsp. arupensis OK-94-513 TaxID=1094562 RepID=J1JUA9_BARVI|nr:hypothetical protein [Bartonella vinsonii]EJF88085.1 hypothetical protein ME1_00804 [Bartonella vinsonii subsp. arupensis OK-94-513]